MLRNVLSSSKQTAVIFRLLSRTAQDSYVPQSPRLWEASTSTANESDLALLRRGDFKGISKDGIHLPSHNPEISLARLQRSFHANFRVPADSILAFVLQLEADDSKTINAIRKAPENWLPLLVNSCGMAMSNLDSSSRQIIFDRLWKQVERHEFDVTIETYNARLKVFLENEIEFNPEEELLVIQNEQDLQPNLKTFQHLLEKTVLRGDFDKFKSLVYKMGTQGHVLDAKCHSFLTYVCAVRGFNQKADSLVEQAELKYNKDAYYLALGACAKAAAARGDLDRLRNVLRRSVGTEKTLQFPPEVTFSIIWELSKRNRNDYGRGSNSQLIEQILERSSRPKGFFRLLFREMERHVVGGTYYTAITLLDDMKRIMDCLENQQKSLFLTQFLARMCRQIIRNRVPMEIVRDVANRVNAIYESSKLAPISVYDELLYSSLMYRFFTLDEKFDYVSALIDTVDSKRERSHIILPLIASVENIDERLQIIYRCGNLGYKDLSKLDIGCLLSLVLKPLHDSVYPVKNGTRLDKTAKVLLSYGVPEKTIWSVFHQWYKLQSEVVTQDKHELSLLTHLEGWLRKHHFTIFESKAATTTPSVIPTYERLKSIVDSRDAAKATNYIFTYGWPEDTNYTEIVTDFLDIVLTHEEWPTVKKFLVSLASRCGHNEASALKNFHVLRILCRAAQEDEISLTNLIDLCYELKRLFPRAVHDYQHFFESIQSYNKLFFRIFDRLNQPEVKEIDQAIDLLRTLVKLEIVNMHPSETLTSMFITNVLRKIGWNEAVNVWMKFQSSLQCSNGIVALIRHCIYKSNDRSSSEIQYLLHKAQNFTSASKVHLLYAGVLISLKNRDGAITYIQNYKNFINVSDCLPVMKLINALKITSLDEDFNIKFLDICLKYTDLKDSSDVVYDIKSYCLRTCESRNLAPLGLRLFKKLKNYNVTFNREEKLRLWKLVEEHSKLAQRWIFGKEGLLRVKDDDSIIKNFDIYSIREELHQEIQELQTGQTTTS